MSQTINLNADMAESYGAWTMGDDAAMLQIVGSANLACGFHAGDPLHMSRALQLAVAHDVSVGAHPSYADLQGFGRRAMRVPDAELRALLAYQIGALDALAQLQGTRVTHVKPHGALSNLACADAHTASLIAQTVAALNADLILLAPACSALSAAAHAAGLRTALEIYADRNYQSDGQLVSRQHPEALITDPAASARHVLRMLEAGGIVTLDGQVLKTDIHSICVHGDGAHAVETAQSVRAALLAAGYTIERLDRML